MHEWPANKLDEEEWDDADWELFLQRGDAQAARFLDLAETLNDDPERKRRVAREMGWDHLLERCRSDAPHCGQCGKEHECEIHRICRLWSAAAAADTHGPAAEPHLESPRLDEIEAYRRGHAFSLELHQRFGHIFDDAPPDDAVFEAMTASSAVPARIASGHSEGYGPDSLDENIAYCERALRSLGKCREALLDIERRGLMPEGQVAELLGMADGVQAAGDAWVGQLRANKVAGSGNTGLW